MNLFLFFLWDFTHTKKHKTHTSNCLPPRCFFMHIKVVFFVFVCFYAFCAFLCVWNLLVKKKERFKVVLIPLFTILLMCTPLNLPTASYLYSLIFIYGHLSESFPFLRIFWIFPFYENLLNLSLLWESLSLIDDHLWKSFPFMRIFWISYGKLFYYLFFITLTYLCVLILIFSYHSKSILICMYSSWSVRIENFHEHK